jgi:hypothetical protein
MCCWGIAGGRCAGLLYWCTLRTTACRPRLHLCTASNHLCSSLLPPPSPPSPSPPLTPSPSFQLDLLFRMTNAVNVEFIVQKLLAFLAAAQDDHFRTDLVGQITHCAERFAPSNAWYVHTTHYTLHISLLFMWINIYFTYITLHTIHYTTPSLYGAPIN